MLDHLKHGTTNSKHFKGLYKTCKFRGQMRFDLSHYEIGHLFKGHTIKIPTQQVVDKYTISPSKKS